LEEALSSIGRVRTSNRGRRFAAGVNATRVACIRLTPAVLAWPMLPALPSAAMKRELCAQGGSPNRGMHRQADFIDSSFGAAPLEDRLAETPAG
jgi:hypothetical protein